MINMVNPFLVLSPFNPNKVSRDTLCKGFVGFMTVGANG